MSAELTKNAAGKWLAWCEECQDGWQGTKRTAVKYMERHNTDRHPE